MPVERDFDRVRISLHRAAWHAPEGIIGLRGGASRGVTDAWRPVGRLAIGGSVATAAASNRKTLGVCPSADRPAEQPARRLSPLIEPELNVARPDRLTRAKVVTITKVSRRRERDRAEQPQPLAPAQTGQRRAELLPAIQCR